MFSKAHRSSKAHNTHRYSGVSVEEYAELAEMLDRLHRSKETTTHCFSDTHNQPVSLAVTMALPRSQPARTRSDLRVVHETFIGGGHVDGWAVQGSVSRLRRAQTHDAAEPCLAWLLLELIGGRRDGDPKRAALDRSFPWSRVGGMVPYRMQMYACQA